MKLRLLAFAFSAFVCLQQPAYAALQAYEGFDYDITEGATLDGKNGIFGWNGEWQLSGAGGEGEFTVLEEGGSLSSPAYPVATMGGRARVAGPGTGGSNSIRIDRTLATPFDLGQDGVLYTSFLFQKDASVPGSNNNWEFDLNPGQVVRVGSTSNDQWFVNVAADAFGSITLGQTYFLVLRMEASELSDDIRSVMIFDPSQTVPSSEPEVWDFSNSVASSAVIDGVRLWIGRLAGGQIDEIRIGSTWESVTVDEVMFPDPTLPGDFNGDGAVDAADYVWWRKFDGNNQAKYDEWRANFGIGSNGGGAAFASSHVPAPEPSTLALALLLCVTMAAARRKAGQCATPMSKDRK